MKINKRIKITSILVGAIIATGALISVTTTVFGAGVPGGNPDIPEPGPNPNPPAQPGQQFWGPRYATWVRYAVNGNNDISFPGYSAYNLSARTLHGCVDDNAEYYYKLSFNWYEVTDGNGTKLIAKQANPIISVSSVAPGGGSISFAGVVNAWNEQGGEGTSIDFDTAHDYFNKTIAANMNSGVSWEDVGAFCWSESLITPCDPNTDPTCGPTVTPATANGEFYSDSTVSVGNSYVTGGASATTQVDGKAAIAFSVYDPDPNKDLDATVHFIHNIYYDAKNFSLGTNDYFKDSSGAHLANNADGTKNTGVAETKWKVTKTSNGTTISTQTETAISGVSATTNGSYTKREDADYTITGLKPGDTRTVCSTISYADKKWSYDSDTHITQSKIVKGQEIEDPTAPGGKRIATDADVRDQIDHQDYYVDSHSGSGSSTVCATVTRANIPDGDPVSPSGTSSSDVMFAGESAPITWDVKAEGIETNRLEYARAIRYLVPVNVGYSSTNVTGDKKTMADPCTYYNARSGISCGNYSDKYWDTDNVMTVSHSDADFHESPLMKVPDLVGYKYCHSFGYHFIPYYAANNNGLTFSSLDYHADSAKAYWYNFNAVCRTIAKKPTVAIWNGSMFTSGGIRTLTANRFNSINFGETADSVRPATSGDLSRTIFGSWSEALTVAGGKIRDGSLTEFASGSVLYIGSALRSLSPANVDNSLYPLTIANSSLDNPGYSGIGINTALKQRLTAYLRRRNLITDEHAGDYTINGDLIWNGGTKIYSIGHNLTINGNIITGEDAAGNSLIFNSIYDLPQVVIFVDGDVNITNNAQRIDAWIIVTGTINTCSTFVKGAGASAQGTSADSALYGIWGSDCANQLIFNGPVMADNLVLNRSFGSNPMTDQMSRMAVAPTSQNGSTYYDSTTGTTKAASDKNTSRQAPAEIFNLRADTYLWAYAQSSRYDSSFTETYSRELAPRY